MPSVMPSIFGIWMSDTSKSAAVLSLRISSRACTPFSASSVWKPSLRRTAMMKFLTDASSSTTNETFFDITSTRHDSWTCPDLCRSLILAGSPPYPSGVRCCLGGGHAVAGEWQTPGCCRDRERGHASRFSADRFLHERPIFAPTMGGMAAHSFPPSYLVSLRLSNSCPPSCDLLAECKTLVIISTSFVATNGF